MFMTKSTTTVNAPSNANGDNDQRGRTFQFFHGRPGAFLQFFARFLKINGQGANLPLPPKEAEERPDDDHPDQNFC